MNIMPICYFPTNAWIIDDNSNYLKALMLILNHENFSYTLEYNQHRALKILNEDYHPDPFINRCLTPLEEESFEHPAISISVAKIHQEIYNPNRFKQISTIAIDHEMPGLTGIEFCQQLKDPYIQKLMLTGAADESTVISAFNRGLIQQFVRKQDRDFTELINHALVDAQYRYFTQLSKTALDTLASSPDQDTALIDPVFIEFFNNLTQHHSIVEYYLCEGIGSFMLLDSHANVSGLFIRTDREMEGLIDLASYEETPQDVMQALRNREKILCYHNRAEAPLPPSAQWKDHLYPAQKLQGKQTYYYAVVPDIFDIDRDRIMSFEKYKSGYYQAIAA